MPLLCAALGSNNYGTSSAMAKPIASKVAMETTIEDMQAPRGCGCVKEYHLERVMRNARITQTHEGTFEVQRIVVSRAMTKYGTASVPETDRKEKALTRDSRQGFLMWSRRDNSRTSGQT